MRVVCVGEAMIELSTDGTNASLGVAGDTLNTAIYLKRTAPQLDVQYVTALGDDSFSERILSFMEYHNIGTSVCQEIHGKSPGLYAIETDEFGERSFTYWRSASAAREMFQISGALDFSALDGADVIYLSAISLAILPQELRDGLYTYLTQSPASLAFDSNYRPLLWEDQETAQRVISSFWAISEICLPSIDDEMNLFNETADQVQDRFLGMSKSGALKRGETGPLSLHNITEDLVFAPAPKVVDSTAAGDSFNGGYLGSILSGSTQSDALQAAHKLASHVIGYRGAIVPEQVDC